MLPIDGDLVESDLRFLRSENTRLGAMLQERNQCIEGMHTHSSLMQHSVRQLEEELAAVRGSNYNLQTQMEQLCRKADDAAANETKLMDEIKALKAKSEQLSSRCGAMSRDNEVLSQQSTTLNDKYVSLLKVNAQLQQQFTALSREHVQKVQMPAPPAKVDCCVGSEHPVLVTQACQASFLQREASVSAVPTVANASVQVMMEVIRSSPAALAAAQLVEELETSERVALAVGWGSDVLENIQSYVTSQRELCELQALSLKEARETNSDLSHTIALLSSKLACTCSSLAATQLRVLEGEESEARRELHASVICDMEGMVWHFTQHGAVVLEELRTRDELLKQEQDGRASLRAACFCYSATHGNDTLVVVPASTFVPHLRYYVTVVMPRALQAFSERCFATYSFAVKTVIETAKSFLLQERKDIEKKIRPRVIRLCDEFVDTYVVPSRDGLLKHFGDCVAGAFQYFELRLMEYYHENALLTEDLKQLQCHNREIGTCYSKATIAQQDLRYRLGSISQGVEAAITSIAQQHQADCLETDCLVCDFQEGLQEVQKQVSQVLTLKNGQISQYKETLSRCWDQMEEARTQSRDYFVDAAIIAKSYVSEGLLSVLATVAYPMEERACELQLQREDREKLFYRHFAVKEAVWFEESRRAAFISHFFSTEYFDVLRLQLQEALVGWNASAKEAIVERRRAAEAIQVEIAHHEEVLQLRAHIERTYAPKRIALRNALQPLHGVAEPQTKAAEPAPAVQAQQVPKAAEPAPAVQPQQVPKAAEPSAVVVSHQVLRPPVSAEQQTTSKAAEPAPAVQAQQVPKAAEPVPAVQPQQVRKAAEPAPTVQPQQVPKAAEPAPAVQPQQVPKAAEPAPAVQTQQVPKAAEPAPTVQPQQVPKAAEPAPTVQPQQVPKAAEPAPTVQPQQVPKAAEPVPAVQPQQVSKAAEPSAVVVSHQVLRPPVSAEQQPVSVTFVVTAARNVMSQQVPRAGDTVAQSLTPSTSIAVSDHDSGAARSVIDDFLSLSPRASPQALSPSESGVMTADDALLALL